MDAGHTNHFEDGEEISSNAGAAGIGMVETLGRLPIHWVSSRGVDGRLGCVVESLLEGSGASIVCGGMDQQIPERAFGHSIAVRVCAGHRLCSGFERETGPSEDRGGARKRATLQS